MTSTDTTEARRARRVAYGLVAVLLVAALAEVELWPLTSFRLFSTPRTGTGSTLELYAVDDDGARTQVPARLQMLSRLPKVADARATTMVDAWLDAAHIAPDDVTTVTLERASWKLDPHTLEREETHRTVVREIQP